jgi:hypothetical protein
VASRLEQFQMLVAFIRRCRPGIFEPGDDDRHPFGFGVTPSHVSNVSQGCDKNAGHERLE